MEHEPLYLNVYFWYAVAFFAFFAFAGKALWNAFTKWIDGRIAKIKHDIDEAATLRTEAELLLQQTKARHDAATTEADAIIAAAISEAAALTKKTQEETEKMIARREQQVMERIAHAEKKALADIQTQTVHMALDMAHDTLKSGISAEAREKLTTAAIAGVKAA